VTEEEARQHAKEDVAYFEELLAKGVPLDVAVKMLSSRILGRMLGEAAKPPPEPWQR